MLVLAASPLVSSAMAASDGRWSPVWGDPANGVVQTAEEEEVGHDAPDLMPAEEAALWLEAEGAEPASALTFTDAAGWLAEPPLCGIPTPPPENG